MKTLVVSKKIIKRWLKNNRKGDPKELVQVTLTVAQMKRLLERALKGYPQK